MRFPRGFYKFPWVLEGFRVLEWFNWGFEVSTPTPAQAGAIHGFRS